MTGAQTEKSQGVCDPAVSPERSRLMARVRGRDTKPEMIVRSLVHGLGYRFRLHRRDLPGSPDLVFPSKRKVVFVHGCFWHRHVGCKKATRPKTRVAFWNEKFDANVERDKRAVIALEEAGWNVKVVWECQTKDTGKLAQSLLDFLEDNETAANSVG